MNKTLFRTDKHNPAYFYELEDGDFFAYQGKLYMKQCGLAVCISECDEHGDYEHFQPDVLVTKAKSFTIARL